ncbi:MAG: transcriptional regulator [Thermoplasmata archaeon HGW-Thermoplasmata-1]|nr:MAG: transcriptional regulator [Thermoplasmata archaeon HGW-Thermoplasmata-1]
MGKEPDLLALENRRNIYRTLLLNPGIHHRELQRRIGMTTGTLEYHLHYLEKKELVMKKRDGRNVRYFVKEKMGRKEKDLMMLLRRKDARDLVMHLLLSGPCTAKDACAHIGLDGAALSSALSQLLKNGIVSNDPNGRLCIENEDAVTELLITYKESFLDETVDRFAEIWVDLGKTQERKKPVLEE